MLIAARWAGTAWPFWSCRREAGASGTRSGKPNYPPASWSSCRLTAAQTLDSQGLTYIRVPAPATSTSLLLQSEASKRWGEYKKGSGKGAGGARRKAKRKQIGKTFYLPVLS